ncbi:MAG: ABC transporter ATP-binding protein [Deltaproteobacteria bacterium]|nr:ABC transporter ATP-binding protein [Deltaproteobacteria bacterium]
MTNAIESSGLGKSFGANAAVKSLDLAVPEGSVFAFFGPNGSGKTTTIKMVMNIIRPSQGEASVLGVKSTELGAKDFAQIGYVSENQEIPEWMTVGRLLNYCKPFYPTWDDGFCQRLLKQYQLPLDRPLKSLSRGMKMKATLLSSLVYRPRLLVLDEPFSGLDVLVRDEFVRGVLELSEQEKWTVFVSSHDIDEVERLADWVGIMKEGELQLCEPVAALQARFRKIDAVLASDVTDLGQVPESWLLVERAGHRLSLVASQYRDGGTEQELRSRIAGCERIDASPMSLREIFLTLARTYQL